MTAKSRFFDAHNARFINDHREVGRDFVYSPALDSVAADGNVAVLGPRGSGKTTLLKMLTLPAFGSWDHPARAHIFPKPKYITAYIPASRTWEPEYRSFSRKFHDEDIENILATSLFRHSVIESIIIGLRSICETDSSTQDEFTKTFKIVFSERQKRDIVTSLSKNWNVPTEFTTLAGLIEAIHTRVRDINRLCVVHSRTRISSGSLLSEYPFLADNFFDDAKAFITIFRKHSTVYRKLCLCFDEMEIAPDVVTEAVMRATRSMDQDILFKFSAAPYVGVAQTVNDDIGPSPKNDLTAIFLSSFSSGDVRHFSEELVSALIKRANSTASITEIFGNSTMRLPGRQVSVETIGAANAQKYLSGGTYQRRFKSLSQKDPSFQFYLRAKGFSIVDDFSSEEFAGAGLSLDDLSIGGGNQRAANIRKILWPVLLRDEFLFDSQRTEIDNSGNNPEFEPKRDYARRIRAKNTISDLYTGADSLLAICEGNPRWIMGLLGPMIKQYALEESKLLNRKPIEKSQQREMILELTSSYFALLSTVPKSQGVGGITSLMDIVVRVGSHFRASILGENFNPDPVLTFKLDEKVHSDVCTLVGKGVEIGAFVVDAGRRSGSIYRVGEVRGMKMRLSNILAPYFRLPFIGGRSINLSNILTKGNGPVQSPINDLFAGV